MIKRRSHRPFAWYVHRMSAASLLRACHVSSFVLVSAVVSLGCDGDASGDGDTSPVTSGTTDGSGANAVGSSGQTMSPTTDAVPGENSASGSSAGTGSGLPQGASDGSATAGGSVGPAGTGSGDVDPEGDSETDPSMMGAAPMDGANDDAAGEGGSDVADDTETNMTDDAATTDDGAEPSTDDSTELADDTGQSDVTDDATDDGAMVGMDDDAENTADDDFDGKELFILFGQSNLMSSPTEEQDRVTNERITFMVEYDCPSLGQSYGEWLVAEPPLHGCQWSENGRLGLGPPDYFAKTVAEAWPDSQIGLIPCGVPGVSIDFYEPGGTSMGESYQALPEGYNSAYTMMVDRARAAQEQGRIRGIIFHQGETDTGQQAWVGKVANIVAQLRTDLELGEEVPFIAGELPPNACCGSHNPIVNQIPDAIPNSAVASAEGMGNHDQYHFDSEAAREMGRRYAAKFLEIVPTP